MIFSSLLLTEKIIVILFIIIAAPVIIAFSGKQQKNLINKVEICKASANVLHRIRILGSGLACL